MIGANILQSMVIQIEYNNGNCNAIQCLECNSNGNYFF